MNLDFDELLQDFHSWKNLLKQKDEEIEILQKQLSFTLKHNEVLEFTRASLIGEVSELNSAAASLRNSLTKIETFEEDRRNLLEEKQKLKNSLESLEKLYYEKSQTLTQELQKMKEANEEKTSLLVSQIKNEASKHLDILKEELKAKENDNQEIRSQMTKLLEKGDQDILKMKIQHEDIIGKLKRQMQRSRIPTPHGLQMNNIFRQKYLKLEKDSEEEITKLKEENQQLVESLKSKNGSTSFISALVTTNKPSTNTTADIATQTENIFTELSRQFTCQTDDDDFEAEKKFNRTQSVVLPQKRKLFNLNENYYSKF